MSIAPTQSGRRAELLHRHDWAEVVIAPGVSNRDQLSYIHWGIEALRLRMLPSGLLAYTPGGAE